MAYKANTSTHWNTSNSSNLSPPPLNSAPPSLTPSRPAPPIPRSTTQSSQQAPSNAFPASSSYNSSNNHYNSSDNSNNSASGAGFGPSGSASSSYSASTGTGSAQTIVRRGWVSVKEDGLRAWIWSKRWLVLREQTLSFYKSEVSVFLVTCTGRSKLICSALLDYLYHKFEHCSTSRAHLGYSGRSETVLHLSHHTIQNVSLGAEIGRRALLVDG